MSDERFSIQTMEVVFCREGPKHPVFALMRGQTYYSNDVVFVSSSKPELEVARDFLEDYCNKLVEDATRKGARDDNFCGPSETEESA